ncbi:uncharacterized protein LOC125648835 [Ostrea edulis]|uniref:uncharacterized protein LOC125648835 n=1 Tax=Ostrea edulis TaxID=37623 RepID=UPI002095A414|nr:uncharacterized protein LOC125648835 [Ostrea edulis]
MKSSTTSLIGKCVIWTLSVCFLVTDGADIRCNGPLGYDVKPLTQGVWTFKAVNQSCLSGPNINATCNITLVFCSKISTKCGESSSACVEAFNYTGKNDSRSISIGNYAQEPFSLTGTVVTATFGMVPLKYNATTDCNLTTVVELNCNRQVEWKSNSNGTTAIPKSANLVPKFERKPTGECQYTIKADFAGACITIVPSLPVTELSAGTVLIIIFFVSISIYCIFGCTCNFVRGYKGQEIVPHFQFWVDLPVLVADGILFTFSCCRREPSAYDSI